MMPSLRICCIAGEGCLSFLQLVFGMLFHYASCGHYGSTEIDRHLTFEGWARDGGMLVVSIKLLALCLIGHH